MKSPIRIFSQSINIVTNSALYRSFLKHTVVRDNDTSIEIRIPKFSKGSVEHFLRFYLEFKAGMADLGYQNNPVELCQEFQAYVSDRPLNRFTLKYNELTNLGTNNLDMN